MMHPDTPTNRVHIQWIFIFKMHIKNQQIIYHFCHDCMLLIMLHDNAYNEEDSKVGIYHNYNIYIIHVYLYLSQEWRKENV